MNDKYLFKMPPEDENEVKRRENTEFKVKRGFRIIASVIFIGAVVSCTVIGVVVYIIAHFIHKLW